MLRAVSTITSINAKLDSALTSSKYTVPGQGGNLDSYPSSAMDLATVRIGIHMLGCDSPDVVACSFQIDDAVPVDLSSTDAHEQRNAMFYCLVDVERTGHSIIGQTDHIVPTDAVLRFEQLGEAQSVAIGLFRTPAPRR